MGHKLGQVFLHDKNIRNKIILAASLQTTDHVLEIGCGNGVLTQSLLVGAQTLCVVEIDDNCIRMTKETLAQLALPVDNLTFIHQDVLKTSFGELANHPFKIVANIPYYISAKLCQLLAKQKPFFESALIMVQKEFAEKLTAAPGDKDYTSLRLFCEYHFEIEKLFTVTKNCFYPVPKVDSAVIRIIPRKSTPFEVDETIFFKLINTAFWGRRKPLRSCLKKGPYIKLKPNFDQCPFFESHPEVRGEKLTLLEFKELYDEIKSFIV